MKKEFFYKGIYKLVYACLIILSTITIAIGQTKTTKMELPKEKQTTLGLYATAKEAFNKWGAAPGTIKILDVRTPDEYINIGHAAMAWNIPSFLQTWQWDTEKKQFPIKPNPDFMIQVKELFKPSDTIYVMCRSGGRSAWAVNQLAAGGYKNIYNITDGMEGDLVKDPESIFNGQRMVNGWKNSGLPWTYHVDPELMKLPNAQ